MQDTITFVKDSSDEEFKNHFKEYFDFDASLNYIVCYYYFGAVDNLAKNMQLVTYDGKKFYPSLYDLDTTYGAFFDGSRKDTYDITFSYEASVLWYRFITLFPEDVAKRWFELRKDIFTKEATMKEFRDFYNLIPEESWTKEKERWGEDNLPGFGLDQIEEFLNFRIKYIDMIMENKLDEESKVKIKNMATEDTNSFNKQLIPMLAVLAGIIVVLVIIEMIVRFKKRK